MPSLTTFVLIAWVSTFSPLSVAGICWLQASGCSFSPVAVAELCWFIASPGFSFNPVSMAGICW